MGKVLTMPKPDYTGIPNPFDKKVRESIGTTGKKKIKILLDAAQIYPKA